MIPTFFRLAAVSLFAALPSFSLFAADQPAGDQPAQPGVVIERAPEQNQDEVATLRAENRRLAADLEEAHQTVDSLRSDLSAATASKERDAASIAEGAREVASLRARVKQLESGGAKVPAATPSDKELATTQHDLEIAKAAAATKTKEAAAEKARADETAARLATIVTGVDQLTAQKTALEAQLEASRNSETALRQQLTAAQEAANRAAAAPSIADLSTKLADAESKLSTAERNLSLAQAENELLRKASSENTRLTSEIQTLQQEKSALEARVNAAPTGTEKVAELTGKLATAEDKLSTTLHSYSLLQEENAKLKADAAQASEKVQAAAAEAETARKEKAELEARVNAAPPAPANGGDLAGKLAATENKLSSALRSYSLLQAENEKLKTDAAQSTDKAQAAETELETLRKQKAEMEAHAPTNPPPTENTSDLAAKLASTEDKLSTVLRSYTLLQNENDQLKAQAAHAGEASQAAAAKSANESSAQITSLFDELRQTQSRAAVLAEENAQLKTRLALVGAPPGSTLAAPTRPGTAAAAESATPAPPKSAAPAATPAGRTHVVVPGDSLTKISRQYYGTPSRWDEILRANRDVIKNENVLPVGATLHIP